MPTHSQRHAAGWPPTQAPTSPPLLLPPRLSACANHGCCIKPIPTCKQVSSAGDLVYAFDKGFKGTLRSKSLLQRARPLLQRAAGAVAYVGRVAFGTALVSSVVLVWLVRACARACVCPQSVRARRPVAATATHHHTVSSHANVLVPPLHLLGRKILQAGTSCGAQLPLFPRPTPHAMVPSHKAAACMRRAYACLLWGVPIMSDRGKGRVESAMLSSAPCLAP